MRDYLLLKNNFLYNSFNINYVMSICWSCGVELGYHQSNKRHPGVADPSSNKYAWGSIIFRRDCVGGYINVFVNISLPLGVN